MSGMSPAKKRFFGVNGTTDGQTTTQAEGKTDVVGGGAPAGGVGAAGAGAENGLSSVQVR